MKAEEKREAVLSSQQVCGACGQFIPRKELDEQGLFHSAKFCQIAIEEELNKTTQEKRDKIHLAMLEDFGNVIAKHLPNFDNNLEEQTWNFLVLFTEEAIAQLLEKGNN